MKYHCIHLDSFASKSFSNVTYHFQQQMGHSLGLIKLGSSNLKQIYVIIHTYFNLKYQLHLSSLVEAVMWGNDLKSNIWDFCSVCTSMLNAHDICPIPVQFVSILLQNAKSICLMPVQSVCILLLNVHYLHQLSLYLFAKCAYLSDSYSVCVKKEGGRERRRKRMSMIMTAAAVSKTTITTTTTTTTLEKAPMVWT